MNGIKFPLGLSLAGHAVCLGLLAFFLSGRPARLPEPIAKGGIEVVFEPAPPKPEAAPPDTTPPPAETPPPPPEPPVAVAESPPPVLEPPPAVPEPTPPVPEAPVATSEPPPPPPVPVKPAVKKPKPVPRHREPPQTSQAYVPSAPSQFPATPAPSAPPQTAMAATPVPAPVPSPEATAGYAALLSAWLNSHKHYPESARHSGEEGNAVLRFEVERSGRVLQYAVVKSSGFPDLDASIEEMMRGAILPPFPPAMTESRREYTVNVRFRLER